MQGIFLFLLLLNTGCASPSIEIQRPTIVCNPNESERIIFERHLILVYPNSHGYYARVQQCGVQFFAVNLSQSGLDTPRYRSLLRSLRSNQISNGNPILLVVSGNISKVIIDDIKRNTVVVESILEYSTEEQVILRHFPESQGL